MKPLNIIIVDDEPRAIRLLKGLLEECFPNPLNEIRCFSTPSEAVTAINNHTPDILFLDIEMPQTSGFSLLEELETISFPVVFVTAHAEFALKAIKVIAVDYLLKPVIKSELQTAVKKCLAFYDIFKTDVLPKLNKSGSDKFYENILVVNKQQHKIITYKEINYLEAKSNYTYIYSINGNKIVMPKSLKYFDELLCCDNHFFIRVHKSHIINTKQIEKYYSANYSSIIKLNSGHEIEVSIRQKPIIDRIMTNNK